MHITIKIVKKFKQVNKNSKGLQTEKTSIVKLHYTSAEDKPGVFFTSKLQVHVKPFHDIAIIFQVWVDNVYYIDTARMKTHDSLYGRA